VRETTFPKGAIQTAVELRESETDRHLIFNTKLHHLHWTIP